MPGFKTNDPDAEAARLKRRFEATTRRIEWRGRWREARWWLTVCAVAVIGAFAGMALLRLVL